jgi:ankyrin repeat protein
MADAALLAVAQAGDENLVRELIDGGTDIETKDRWGATPLMIAVQSQHEHLVRMLLQAGADINTYNINTQSLMYRAVMTGNEAILRLLLENGANTTFKSYYNDETPLSIAITMQKLNVVKILVDYGADIELESEFSQTALQRAADIGNEAISQLLVERGANVVGNEFQRPLTLAATSGNANITKILLNAGADTEARVDDKYESGCSDATALHLAACGGHLAVVQALIDGRADVNARDATDFTPLHCAAIHDRLEVARLLLKHGADITAKDEDGACPSDVADTDDMKELLKISSAST